MQLTILAVAKVKLLFAMFGITNKAQVKINAVKATSRETCDVSLKVPAHLKGLQIIRGLLQLTGLVLATSASSVLSDISLTSSRR